MIPASTNQLLSYTGYRISRSLRFRSSASAYLSRTPASAGNQQKWTWSGWVKLGAIASNSDFLLACYVDANNMLNTQITNAGQIQVYGATAGSTTINVLTNAVYRDPSSWYYVVLAVDTTSATSTITGSSSDRIRIYINGVQISSFATSIAPSQNYNTFINTTNSHTIGHILTYYSDYYLAEVNFIDGQALTPSSFGAFDTNGVWQPARYTGSYGTNGFYLPFSDNSALTTASNAGIGKDFSGNSNYWVTNNISITAGTTYDSMIDSPTNYADGGNGRGNYAVLNPLMTATTLSNANLNSNPGSASWLGVVGTLGFTTGKFYYEATITASTQTYFQIIGVARSTIPNSGLSFPGNTSDGWGVQLGTPSYKINNGSFTALGSNYSYSVNDIIQIAVDVDAGKIWYGINNAWIESGNPSTGANALFTNLSGTIVPMIGQNTSGNSCAVNFGQRPFTYTPPSGFSALNTQNLPTPTIAAGNKYFDATTYTGNGTSQSITNNGSFQPDLVWIKPRVAAGTSHVLTDAVRGVSKFLSSNGTSAESSVPGFQLTAFNSNGFTLVDNANGDYGVNGASGGTYSGTPPNFIAWQWNAGGSTVTNTSGSISSQVRANTSAGFSVVTYTGTGANATVGHGLGVAPSMIIVKGRGASGDQWPTYHISSGVGNWLRLSGTNVQTADTTVWNNTAPTSSVFSIGSSGQANSGSYPYVAYCFAPVAGYSAFGSYTGNGSTDGPFIYLGFRPRYLLIKCTTFAEQWAIKDSARVPYNTNNAQLFANASSVEDNNTTYHMIDFNANGFKVRGGAQELINGNGQTYIYAAFAENPFKYSRAR